MGAWDVGPFDNDSAADWCGDLEDAPAEQRADLVRNTLLFAINCDEYLDVDDGSAAIAAAAIVAAQLPGQPPITSPYAPDFLTVGGSIEFPDDTPGLAVRALDRVLADESEWADLWADANPNSPAFAVVRELRRVLAAAEDRYLHPGDDLFSAGRNA
ncbi:DUF4259 domain-containing protein [Hamadaea sp. NPDC051192]|uniref:DUF4259 domain-containing protein n=1 Tax=Hamadaea sp. NPDC051192 TaxID=3154940 RepID=UPI003421E59D